MDTILQANNLTKIYGAKTALDGVSLDLKPGKIIGLLGPNGSGKTTLIKLAAGLLTPNSGDLQICGEPVGVETKALVSYLPDRVYFSQGQRIKDVLDYFETFYRDFDRLRAEQMLSILGIDLNLKFKSLSKGAKEKVQLALVMSRRAKLYLLDEPIAGVDPAARDYILRTIVNNYGKEATVVISTHLIADVEPILDEYIFIHNGRILSCGTVEQVKQETGKTLDAHFREVFQCSPSF